MVDELEEKPGEGLNLQQYVDVIRRRHMYFLIPFFLGWLVVWSASWVLPSRYKSGTLILVEQPSMPKDYVTPNVTDDLQARLQSITQQILSRTRLLHIIDELNLYADKRGRLNPDELVERMRKDIEIELVYGIERHQITSFNIYYSSHDPHVAQQVTSELTNLVHQRESGAAATEIRRHHQVSRTTTGNSKAELWPSRKKRSGYTKISIWESCRPNCRAISKSCPDSSPNCRAKQDGLNADRQQSAYLQSMLEQSRALQRTTKSGDGTPVGIPALDQELDKLKAQLADLSSHYTDRHPDVRKVKDQIAKTEKMRDAGSRRPEGRCDHGLGEWQPARVHARRFG